MLALNQQLGQSYQQLLDHVQSHGGSLLDRELDVLGFDHCVLSARLLMHWELPAPLCAAVAAFPDEARIVALEPVERTLPQILHLAELLARLIEQPYGPALAELLDVGGRYCGLTFEGLQPIAIVLQTAVEELAEVLALDLPAGESYTDLLLASQTRLAELTASAVAAPAKDPEDELLELTGELRREIESVVRGRKTTVIRRQPVPYIAVEPTSAATCVMPTRPVAIATAEPSLIGRVGAAIVRCRQAALSADAGLGRNRPAERVGLARSPAAVADLLHELRIALDEWIGERAAAMLVGEATFALVCEGCPRSEAIQTIRQVLRNIKTWPAPTVELAAAELTLSAGVATLAFPPRNFPAEQLIDAAQRCLNGASLSGGDTLKSIEF